MSVLGRSRSAKVEQQQLGCGAGHGGQRHEGLVFDEGRVALGDWHPVDRKPAARQMEAEPAPPGWVAAQGGAIEQRQPDACILCRNLPLRLRPACRTKRSSRCKPRAGFQPARGGALRRPVRHRLEQLCQSITRPAVANKRAQCSAAGQVVIKLETAWRNGPTHIVMSPLEFMQFAALVPLPRLHLIRLHGVLPPNSKLRAMVVPQGREA